MMTRLPVKRALAVIAAKPGICIQLRVLPPAMPLGIHGGPTIPLTTTDLQQGEHPSKKKRGKKDGGKDLVHGVEERGELSGGKSSVPPRRRAHFA